jgi:hypothetical protein
MSDNAMVSLLVAGALLPKILPVLARRERGSCETRFSAECKLEFDLEIF